MLERMIEKILAKAGKRIERERRITAAHLDDVLKAVQHALARAGWNDGAVAEQCVRMKRRAELLHVCEYIASPTKLRELLAHVVSTDASVPEIPAPGSAPSEETFGDVLLNQIHDIHATSRMMALCHQYGEGSTTAPGDAAGATSDFPIGKAVNAMANQLQRHGFAKMEIPSPTELEEAEQELRQYQAVLDSMTREERHDARLIDAKRCRSIAKGSGLSEAVVRDMIAEMIKAERLYRNLRNRQ